MFSPSSSNLTADQKTVLADVITSSAQGLLLLDPGSGAWDEQLDLVLEEVRKLSVTGSTDEDLPLSEPTHEDVPSMMEDILAFVAGRPERAGEMNVLAADDPRSRLVGYSAFYVPDGQENSMFFSVRIETLKTFNNSRLRLPLLKPGIRRRVADLLARGVTADLSIGGLGDGS